MSNRPWTLEECNEAFEDQRELLREAAGGSQFVPCNDKISFDGTCYDPTKVIFSDGRVWGLRSHDFIDLTNSENEHGYKVVKVSATAKLVNEETNARYNPHDTMTVHKLVANYFCDKSIFDVMRQVNEKEGYTVFDLSIDDDGNCKDVNIHHKDH